MNLTPLTTLQIVKTLLEQQKRERSLILIVIGFGRHIQPRLHLQIRDLRVTKFFDMFEGNCGI